MPPALQPLMDISWTQVVFKHKALLTAAYDVTSSAQVFVYKYHNFRPFGRHILCNTYGELPTQPGRRRMKEYMMI